MTCLFSRDNNQPSAKQQDSNGPLEIFHVFARQSVEWYEIPHHRRLEDAESQRGRAQQSWLNDNIGPPIKIAEPGFDLKIALSSGTARFALLRRHQ